MRSANPGTDPGNVQAFGRRPSATYAGGFERLNLAFDGDHIRVRVGVSGQQSGVLGLEAGQVLKLIRSGFGTFCLGGHSGIGSRQLKLKITQLFLRRFVVAVDFPELQFRT
ncbi:hypothetical protein D3C78_578510 [compost metagenome]